MLNLTISFQVASKGEWISNDHDTITLIDEADFILIDQECKIRGSSSRVIGLTATAFSELVTERQLLQAYGFMITDSKIAQNQILKADGECTRQEFLTEAKYSKMARLIYARKDQIEYLKLEATQYGIKKIHINEENLDTIRNMELGSVFIIDDDH